MLKKLGDFIKHPVIDLVREGCKKVLNFALNQQNLCGRH
jgi:hypothetical protein